jgi:hypothetical protein
MSNNLFSFEDDVKEINRKAYRVNLNVPKEDMKKVRALGARWDSENRIWYVLKKFNDNMFPFSAWITTIGKPNSK